MNALSTDTKRNEHRLRCKSTAGTFHSSLHVRPDGCGKRKRGVQASDIPVKARPYQVLFAGVQVAVEWRGWRGERSGQTLSTGGWRGELPLIFYVGSSDCCLLIVVEVLSFNNKTGNLGEAVGHLYILVSKLTCSPVHASFKIYSTADARK